MTRFLKRIESGEILLSDGAMGTMLFERGLMPGDCPEKVNLTNPAILEEIANLYLQAGADLIQTNTFGASPLKLASYGLEGEMEAIIRNAVQAVKNVVKGKTLVLASVGPTGKILKPYGDTDPEVIFKAFERQISLSVESGADVICIETMIDLREAELAIQAAKSISGNIPVVSTMTFDLTKRGFFTVMGVSIEKAAKGLKHAGADIIGSNCGNGIENMIRIAHEFKKLSDLPIIIQSNAGLPIIQEGSLVYPETPEFMAQKVKELISLGVSVIGGCCGTTPDHIAAFRKVLNAQKK